MVFLEETCAFEVFVKFSKSKFHWVQKRTPSYFQQRFTSLSIDTVMKKTDPVVLGKKILKKWRIIHKQSFWQFQPIWFLLKGLKRMICKQNPLFWIQLLLIDILMEKCRRLFWSNPRLIIRASRTKTQFSAISSHQFSIARNEPANFTIKWILRKEKIDI